MTAIAAKTREPKDEQLCKAVNIKYILHNSDTLDRSKEFNAYPPHCLALHNMWAHLGSQN